MTTMPDGNTAAMHAHLDDEERRERIGQRAEELLNDWVAEDANNVEVLAGLFRDDSALCSLVHDLLSVPSVQTRLLREAIYAKLRERRRDEAIAQAESEAG